MKHPEQDYAAHDERMSKADKIKFIIATKEVWEILERLDEAEQSSDALGKTHVRRARDELNAALDRIAEVLA